jgi:hypothetical protein
MNGKLWWVNRKLKFGNGLLTTTPSPLKRGQGVLKKIKSINRKPACRQAGLRLKSLFKQPHAKGVLRTD